MSSEAPAPKARTARAASQKPAAYVMDLDSEDEQAASSEFEIESESD